MVPLPHQCLSHSGKVCNYFLPSKVRCATSGIVAKTVMIGEYLAKLSVQHELKKER